MPPPLLICRPSSQRIIAFVPFGFGEGGSFGRGGFRGSQACGAGSSLLKELTLDISVAKSKMALAEQILATVSKVGSK